MFVEASKHGSEAVDVIENALPEDAKLLTATYDQETATVQILLESASFSAVRRGDVVPIVPTPVFRKRE